MDNWRNTLKNSKKACIQEGNLRKVHYDLPNGEELVEEYNMDTGVVNRRAWKIKKELGGEGEWLIELGDPIPTPGAPGISEILIKENSNQPFVSFRVTKKLLEWRIRNLPYPIEVYDVRADTDNRCIIISTTNKKYYKILHIPEFDRLHLNPSQNSIEFSHKFNTLIITVSRPFKVLKINEGFQHKKPIELIDFEKAVYEEVKMLKVRKEGDLDCKPS